MNNRSSGLLVRNPILKLASAGKLQTLPDEAKDALSAVLLELRQDCRENAEKSWRKHKAPMAAYWKAASVYVGHIARALRMKDGCRHDHDDEVSRLRREVASKQAQIDSLMLEYCPDEMTDEQMGNWERHQIPSSMEREIALSVATGRVNARGQ